MGAVCCGTTGVEIDVCAGCKGIWLDKGEFQKILGIMETEANSKTSLELLKTTLREGLEILNGPESVASEWKDFTQACSFLGRRCVIENPTLFSAVAGLQRLI